MFFTRLNSNHSSRPGRTDQRINVPVDYDYEPEPECDSYTLHAKRLPRPLSVRVMFGMLRSVGLAGGKV